ncbi:MAG: putative baseplate assembly protein [Phycisphaerae bacterium]|nr:putative baseplate assembly protein [Phycisphaerae bacterium]
MSDVDDTLLTPARYSCCDDDRVLAVRALSGANAPNGIEFLEVLDADAPLGMRQRILRVSFVRAPAPALTKANMRISGGERIRDVRVESTSAAPGDPRSILVSVDRAGDFSGYTLRIVRGADALDAPDGIDPALASVDFSFKVECPTPFDCADACHYEPSALASPEIDYLAKDYGAFRRLILDRLTTLMPDWTEGRRQNPADLGVTIAELLAHVGDRLSYLQDAIGTEAYLRTARLRTSLRRHARLVDYRIDDGRNARVWARIEVDAGASGATLPAGTALATAISGAPTRLPASSLLLERADCIFETLHSVALHAQHAEMQFHTWSGARCCIPRSATRATLRGHFPALVPGTVLAFVEKRSPRSGLMEEADRTRRHFVRLTAVRAFTSGSQRLTDQVLVAQGEPTERTLVTEIAWADADTLPFELCVSAVTDSTTNAATPHEDVGVALGNIVLADHGRTITGDTALPFATVPQPALVRRVAVGSDRCEGFRNDPVPARFRPSLPIAPLTVASPYDHAAATSAAEALSPVSRTALPVVALREIASGALWTARHDLLDSDPDDRHFVVEVEHGGDAFVRFGDDEHGRRPETGVRFAFIARVGNGLQGNIGTESLRHVATNTVAAIGVSNLAAAKGGAAPESADQIRRRAPVAFRRQERAVTEADYARIAEESSDIQRAVATFRWTGSWHTAFVTVDRREGAPVNEAFESELRGRLDRYRLTGHDVEVEGPRPVAIDLALRVCVKREFFSGHVARALLDVFNARRGRDGRLGLFHPDRFTFGQTMYLSPFVAAAQAVRGVASVEVTRFGRRGDSDPRPRADGQLQLDRLEIARLDNDPSFPERGVFTLELAGGAGGGS